MEDTEYLFFIKQLYLALKPHKEKIEMIFYLLSSIIVMILFERYNWKLRNENKRLKNENAEQQQQIQRFNRFM